ncbi:MAG: hypothetical protein WBQ66_08700, partial [Blastocatellia bacterium]
MPIREAGRATAIAISVALLAIEPAGIAARQGRGAESRAGWRRIVPPGGGVSVEMPGAPTHSVKSYAGSGLTWETHDYVLLVSGEMFTLVHCAYPDEVSEGLRNADPETVFGYWKSRL